MATLSVVEKDGKRIYELTAATISIGRSRSNDIKLEDDVSSRKQCQIIKTLAGYKILDLKSSNGTFVNGVKVSEKLLASGDRIEIGKAFLLFDSATNAIAEPHKTATNEIIFDEEIGRKSETGKESAQTSASITLSHIKDNKVKMLLETMAAGAASPANSTEFQSRILDTVISIANAERGILFIKETNTPKIMLARNNNKEMLENITDYSKSVVAKVLDTAKPIRHFDSGVDTNSQGTPSMEMYQLRTVMCTPLLMKQSTYGAIYVDSKASAKEFTDEDLAMFEAVTNYLALVIENARLAEELFRKEEESRLSLERENVRLRQALESRAHLIGECPQMKSLYEIVKKVAPTDATVLISGESGTGKEVMAHILHDLSNRNKNPFVAVDCAAIPETLLESELFGHEKGAFTGAIAQKLGKLELANSGTLFLDEIGDMSLILQTKLLRVMQEREIVRVGGTASVKIDVRIITATNKDLQEMVSKGQFRQELYFRLNVISIKLPPLRERENDIKLLAVHFLKDVNVANGRTIEGFTPDAEELMARHKWSGNVRELKHRIEQAVILSDTGKRWLSAEDLCLVEKGLEEFKFSQFEEARDKFGKQLIQNALLKHSHNVTHTAKSLGLSRQHLQNLIKKYEIARP